MTYNDVVQDGILDIKNPAVVFQFSVFPDAAFAAETRENPSVGWKGDISVEACLMPDEAAGWPNSGDRSDPRDPNTWCSPDDGPATAQWYQVGDAALDDYTITNFGSKGLLANIPVNFHQILTPIRFHVDGTTYYYPNLHIRTVTQSRWRRGTRR